jgi:uncharacterized 2Fe-2S/4Fe-4S cluster protein (DUF4445 family)
MTINHYQVTILPENIEVTVPGGTTLLAAVAKAGIQLDSPCGGHGICGKCAVRVLYGRIDRVCRDHLPAELASQGYVPACQVKVTDDLIIGAPAFARLAGVSVLSADNDEVLAGNGDAVPERHLEPICIKQVINLEPPAPAAVSSDLERVLTCLRNQTGFRDVCVTLSVLRQLPQLLRQSGWTVTATLVKQTTGWQAVALEPGRSAHPAYGIAVDLGTTTVALNLLDLETGRVIAKAGGYNQQSLYGSDLISRIIFADEQPEGLTILHQTLVKTVNILIAEVLHNTGLKPSEISAVACAGNTVMSHLFLNIPVTHLRLEPYVPAAQKYPQVRAAEIGLNVNPDAWVSVMPAVASYVGGDIAAGVFATAMDESDRLTLFIDIGTNGELVLGNSQWMVTCACSAGPAFEGSGVCCGIRAMDGAIEAIQISDDWEEIAVKTIGGREPLGICGSGLINTISELLDAGIIDRTGTLGDDKPAKRIRSTDAGREFILVFAAESGTGNDIVITESDIKNVLRAKAAIFAGIMTMLKQVDLEPEAIDRIYIAGGFGNYIRIPDAINLGLLPDLPVAKYQFVGNTSLRGAMLGLLSRITWEKVEKIAGNLTYLELSTDNRFMEEFSAALFIPHTHLDLFPSRTRR